jgi:hypothetical protein
VLEQVLMLLQVLRQELTLSLVLEQVLMLL